MKLCPRVYMGTMTFGWSQASSKVDLAIGTEMVKRYAALGGRFIDTARIYSGGECESLVGKTVSGVGGLCLGSKASPSQTGGLSPEGIQSQLDISLRDLGISQLAELYLHQPDTQHPLVDSLRKAHELVSAGVVGKIGLSNYHAAEVARCFALCDEHGWTKPSVYQGLYNPLNRMVEAELLPLLKEHGCSFVAYNPLAAGLLSGKHAAGGEVPAGRFKDNENYLPRFYTQANFEALEKIRAACEASGITMVEASFAWLLQHSKLGPEDGLLIGASSLEQLDANLAACTEGRGPLAAAVLAAFNDAWDVTKDGAFAYWRSYSSDMPGREQLDQGAAYKAHGPPAK